MNTMTQRAELSTHTKMGPMNACTDIRALFERAKQKGVTAVAITDTNSVHAFRMAEMAAREYGVKFIHGCELMMETGGEPCPILVYVREQKGLRNLHELVSLALGRESGTVTREEVQARRYGLLVAGVRELWLMYMNDRPLTEKLRFYDAVAFTLEDLETAPGLIELAEEAGVPAFLAGDVRYTDEEDKLAYTILKNLPPDNTEKRHLMSAEELKREADGIDDRTLHGLIENSVRFAERFDETVKLFPCGDRMTLLEIEAGEKLKDLAMEKAQVLYGGNLPEDMEKRISEEAENAVRDGQAQNLLLLSGFFSRCRIPAKACRSGGNLLPSLLFGLRENDPLPRNIPGLPLPERVTPAFAVPEGTLLPVYPNGPFIKCALLSRTEPETAFALLSRRRKMYRCHFSPEEAEKAMNSLTGIARGIIQDPDTYLLLEEGMDPFRYGPVRNGVLQLDIRNVPQKTVRLIFGK